MGFVDKGTAMSRTNASDPWEIGKAFLIQVRLRTAKPSSSRSMVVDSVC